jgi:hypothetical protein
MAKKFKTIKVHKNWILRDTDWYFNADFEKCLTSCGGKCKAGYFNHKMFTYYRRIPV